MIGYQCKVLNLADHLHTCMSNFITFTYDHVYFIYCLLEIKNVIVGMLVCLMIV